MISGLCFLALGCAEPGKKTTSDSDRAKLHVEIASSALAEGDPTGALQSLAAAEQLDDRNPDIYHTRAIAYLTKTELDQAEKSAEMAVELDPKNPDYRTTYGKILLDQGKYPAAEKNLLLAQQDTLFRGAYKAATNLGILYYRKGNDTQAEKYFSDAIKKSPSGACIAHYYRGHLALKKGKFADSIKDYDRSIRNQCGGFTEGYYALGIAYERYKKFDEARKRYLEVTDKFPESPFAQQAMERLRRLP